MCRTHRNTSIIKCYKFHGKGLCGIVEEGGKIVTEKGSGRLQRTSIFQIQQGSYIYKHTVVVTASGKRTNSNYRIFSMEKAVGHRVLPKPWVIVN